MSTGTLSTNSWVNDVQSIPRGTFSDFTAATTETRINATNGAWTFTAWAGVIHRTVSGVPTIPSSSNYVGFLSSVNGSTEQITTNLTGFDVGTPYSLRLAIGGRTVNAFTRLFQITVQYGSTTLMIWNKPVIQSDFIQIETQSFIPTNTTVTIRFISRANIAGFAYVLIDNLQVLRNTAITSVTNVLNPWTSNVFNIPGGRFLNFNTTTTTANINASQQAWDFSVRAGVAFRTNTGMPTIPSSSDYVGYFQSINGSVEQMTVNLTDFDTTQQYALAFNLGGLTNSSLITRFSIAAVSGSTSVTIWDQAPNSTTFVSCVSRPFRPINTTVRFVITAFTPIAGTYVLLIDNLRVLRGAAIVAPTTTLGPWTNNIFTIPGGDFTGFSTTTTSVNINGTIANWAFSGNAGVFRSTFNNLPTVPEGRTYVGHITTTNNSNDSISVTLQGLDTSTSYAISFNMGAYSWFQSARSFVVSVSFDSTQVIVWNKAPITSSFVPCVTRPFTPTTSIVTVTFSNTTTANGAYPIFIDNVRLLRGAGITDPDTSLLNPWVNDVFNIPRGNFTGFNNTLTSVSLSTTLTNWTFSQNSGVWHRSFYSISTVPSGSDYVGFLSCLNGSFESITLYLSDLDINTPYALSFNMGYTIFLMSVTSFRIRVQSQNATTSTVIWNKAPLRPEFVPCVTQSFIPTSPYVTITISAANNLSTNAYVLIDNLRLLRGDAITSSQPFLPWLNNVVSVPQGNFTGFTTALTQQTFNGSYGIWTFPNNCGVIHRSALSGLSYPSGSNYGAWLSTNNYSSNFFFTLDELDTSSRYALRFNLGGFVTYLLPTAFTIQATHGNTTDLIYNRAPLTYQFQEITTASFIPSNSSVRFTFTLPFNSIFTYLLIDDVKIVRNTAITTETLTMMPWVNDALSFTGGDFSTMGVTTAGQQLLSNINSGIFRFSTNTGVQVRGSFPTPALSSINGIVSDFDASANVTVTSGSVSSWGESVNSFVASQNDSIRQPVVTNNFISTFPAVNFSTVSGSHLISNSSVSTTTSMTLFFVLKTTGTKTFSQFLSSKGAWAAGNIHLYFNNGPLVISINSTNSVFNTGFTPTTNSSCIICVMISNVGGCISTPRLNGSQGGSFTHSTTAVNLNPNFELGAWSQDPVTRSFSGGIGEFVYYNRLLTPPEIAAVEASLTTKWGIFNVINSGFHPYRSIIPTSLYSSPYVGLIRPNNTTETITFSFYNLENTQYALVFSMGGYTGTALPSTFTVTANNGPRTLLLWDIPPNEWNFREVITSSFTPASTTITFTFTSTSPGFLSYILLDNIRLLRGSAAATPTATTLSWVNNVLNIPQGNFAGLTTATTQQSLGNQFLGNLRFSQNAGVVHRSVANVPTIPSGNDYVAYLNNNNTSESLILFVNSLEPFETYALQFSMGSYLNTNPTYRFTIDVLNNGRTTRIWNKHPNSSTFTTVVTEPFTTSSRTIQITFSSTNTGWNQMLLLDNIQILRRSAITAPTTVLAPWVSNVYNFAYGTFTGISTNTSSPVALGNLAYGPWRFWTSGNGNTGIVHQNVSGVPTIPSTSSYVAYMQMNNSTENIQLIFNDLDVTQNYAMRFAFGGYTNAILVRTFSVRIQFIGSNMTYLLWDRAPNSTSFTEIITRSFQPTTPVAIVTFSALMSGMQAFILLDNIRLVRGNAITPPTSILSSWTSNVLDVPGGRFTGFTTSLTSAGVSNQNFGIVRFTSTSGSGTNIIHRSQSNVPTIPSGSDYVLQLGSASGTDTVSFSLQDLDTNSRYALRLSFSGTLDMPTTNTFRITTVSGDQTHLLWDRVPSASSFVEIVTESFIPQTHMITVFLTTTGSGSVQQRILIDNVQILRNAAITSSTDILSPWTSDVSPVWRGNFTGFTSSTSTTPLSTGVGPFSFSPAGGGSVGVIHSTVSGVPTIPSGSNYAGFIRPNNTNDMIMVRLSGFDLTRTYALAFAMGGMTTQSMVSTFTIVFTNGSATQTIWNTAPSSATFVECMTNSFVPLTRTLTFFFQATGGTSRTLLLDNLRVVRGSAITSSLLPINSTSAAISEGSWVSDIQTLPRGNFGDFTVATTSTILNRLDGAWFFSTTAGVVHRTVTDVPTIPSGNNYVGWLNVTNNVEQQERITTNISGLDTGTTYALRFSMGGFMNNTGLPQTFIVTISWNNTVQTIWNKPPIQSGFVSCTTSTFQPGATTITVSFIASRSIQDASHILIDNPTLLRGTAITSPTILVPTTSTFNLERGNFTNFTTNTTSIVSLLSNRGSWVFSTNTGTVFRTVAGIPTIPSGSNYVGYMAPTSGGRETVSYTLRDLDTSVTYALGFAMGAMTTQQLVERFTVRANGQIIWDRPPNTHSFVSVVTNTFQPSSTTVTLLFEAEARQTAVASQILLDNIVLLRDAGITSPTQLLTWTADVASIPRGDFTGFTTNTSYTSLSNIHNGIFRFSEFTGVTHRSLSTTPTPLSSSNYVGVLDTTNGTIQSITFVLNDLDVNTNYSFTFGLGGMTNFALSQSLRVIVIHGSTSTSQVILDLSPNTTNFVQCTTQAFQPTSTTIQVQFEARSMIGGNSYIFLDNIRIQRGSALGTPTTTLLSPWVSNEYDIPRGNFTGFTTSTSQVALSNQAWGIWRFSTNVGVMHRTFSGMPTIPSGSDYVGYLQTGGGSRERITLVLNHLDTSTIYALRFAIGFLTNLSLPNTFTVTAVHGSTTSILWNRVPASATFIQCITQSFQPTTSTVTFLFDASTQLSAGTSQFLLLDNIDLLRGSAASTPTATLQPSWVNNILNISGGNFSGFSTTTAIVSLGASFGQWFFATNSGVGFRTDSRIPTIPSGNDFVGVMQSVSGSIEIIRVTLNELSTTTTYAIGFAMGGMIGSSLLARNFNIIVSHGNNEQIVWDKPPNDNTFVECVSQTFQPTTSSITITFTITSNLLNLTTNVLLDNIRLLRSSAIVNPNTSITSWVNNVLQIARGTFTGFSTTTTFTTLGNTSNWSFTNAGVAHRTYTPVPTIPSGSNYVGYLQHSSINTNSSITVTISDLTPNTSYAVRFHAGGFILSANGLPHNFNVMITSGSTVTTVWRKPLLSRQFTEITTESFTPTTSVIQIIFTSSQINDGFFATLLDNIRLVRGTALSGATNLLQPWSSNILNIPGGDFRNNISTNTAQALNSNYGNINFSLSAGVVHRTVISVPTIPSGNDYVAYLNANRSTEMIIIRLTDLDTTINYALRFAMGGPNNAQALAREFSIYLISSSGTTQTIWRKAPNSVAFVSCVTPTFRPLTSISQLILSSSSPTLNTNIYIDNLQLLRGDAIVPPTIILNPWDADVYSVPYGNFLGLSTTTTTANLNASYGPVTFSLNSGVARTTLSTIPTVPSGNSYVGYITNVNRVFESISFTLNDFDTSTRYAIQFAMGGYTNVAMPREFQVTVIHGSTRQIIWNTPPNSSSFLSCITESFRPTSPSVTIIFTTRSSTITNTILLDNIRIVRRSAVVTPPGIMQPWVNNTYTIPGGDFLGFSTTTTIQNINATIGAWTFSTNSGVVRNTHTGVPTIPSGDLYAGYIMNSFGPENIQVVLTGFETNMTYRLSFNMGALTNSNIVEEFTVNVITESNIETIWNQVPTTSTFTSCISSPFTPTSTSAIISFVANSQPGANYYVLLDSIVLLRTITRFESRNTPTFIETPQRLQVQTTKPNIASMDVVLRDIPLTNSDVGVAFGIGTGYSGVVSKFTITATDISSNPVTDFSSDPVQLSLTLPNANTQSTLAIYKTDADGVILSTQPAGYPVLLTYNSNTGLWTGALPSLSNYIVLDTNPPSGSSGGDPYIQTIDGKVHMIPNEWKYVRLYEHEDTSIYVKCDYLRDPSILEDLHSINGKGELPDNVDIITEKHTELTKEKHWWVHSITYMTQLDIYIGSTLHFSMNLLNGQIIKNSRKLKIDRINDNKGLYSLIHKRPWEIKRLQTRCIHLGNGNYILVKIDNYWDDINQVTLYVQEKDYSLYEGEFFGHSASNNLS